MSAKRPLARVAQALLHTALPVPAPYAHSELGRYQAVYYALGRLRAQLPPHTLRGAILTRLLDAYPTKSTKRKAARAQDLRPRRAAHSS